MTKQTKRKGFTAVEMLIVIAVIAVLVSVVVPVVNGSNVKAKAATNAANLRAVEATISLKMLNNPEDFEAFFDKGKELQRVSDGPLGKVYNFFFGAGDAEASRVKYDFLADNGKNQLQIPGSGLVISGLTLSKGLEAPRRDGGTGLVIDDDQGMRVCITEAGPLAFYGDYTKEDFADVAEDGYYDGMVTGTGGNENNGWLPDWIENPVEELTCKSGLLENKHQTGPGCVCPYCGAEAHIDADKTTSWGMTEYLTSTSRHACRCGKVFNGDHKYEGSDHACKYNDCDKVTTCIDRNPESWRDEDDHKCYLCGGDNNHAWCTTDNRGGGRWGNQPDHKCDTCGYEMSKCDAKGGYNDDTHTCSYCGKKNPHAYVDGVCACGRPSHVAPNDCKDENRDHICDLGCGYDKVGGEHNASIKHDGNGNHVCSHCGKGAVQCTDSNRDHNCDKNCGNTTMGNSCGAAWKDTGDLDYHYCKYCGKNPKKHTWTQSGSGHDTKHSCSCGASGYCEEYENAFGNCSVCGFEACITPDTLITLADGTQKRVDELTGTEQLLVWDHAAGKFSTAPVAYIINHNKVVKETEIITLIFSDGNIVKMIGEHVFFDADEGKYVAITSANAERFIGHSFAAKDAYGNFLHMTELVDVVRSVEETEIYEIATYRNLTCFTNNVLSSCAFLDELLNIFEIDTATMAYDAEAMQADLEKYGTIDYAFFAPFVSREIFDMYNGEYMSVAMGKGVLSLGDILDLIDLHHLYIGE